MTHIFMCSFMKNRHMGFAGLIFALYICIPFAGIAQLVEHDLAKVGVAGPSPVSRSSEKAAPQGVAFSTLLHLDEYICIAVHIFMQINFYKPGWRNRS